jgi:hypothetical protein
MSIELPPLEYVWTHKPRTTLLVSRESVEARERILLDRVAELEADAERYRWLRLRNEAIKGIDPPGPYVVEDDDGETHYPGGAELDAARGAK